MNEWMFLDENVFIVSCYWILFHLVCSHTRSGTNTSQLIVKSAPEREREINPEVLETRTTMFNCVKMEKDTFVHGIVPSIDTCSAFYSFIRWLNYYTELCHTMSCDKIDMAQAVEKAENEQLRVEAEIKANWKKMTQRKKGRRKGRFWVEGENSFIISPSPPCLPTKYNYYNKQASPAI